MTWHTCFYSSGTFTRPESQGDRGHGLWEQLGWRVALLGVLPTTGTSGPVIWDLEWDQRESGQRWLLGAHVPLDLGPDLWEELCECSEFPPNYSVDFKAAAQST